MPAELGSWVTIVQVIEANRPRDERRAAQRRGTGCRRARACSRGLDTLGDDLRTRRIRVREIPLPGFRPICPPPLGFSDTLLDRLRPRLECMSWKSQLGSY